MCVYIYIYKYIYVGICNQLELDLDVSESEIYGISPKWQFEWENCAVRLYFVFAGCANGCQTNKNDPSVVKSQIQMAGLSTKMMKIMAGHLLAIKDGNEKS